MNSHIIVDLQLEVEGTVVDGVKNPEELIANTVRDYLENNTGLRVNSCDPLPDINTGDLKLKHLKYALSTYGAIRIKWLDTNESFSPSLGNIEQYYDYYVVDIEADNDVLVISIKGEI